MTPMEMILTGALLLALALAGVLVVMLYLNSQSLRRLTRGADRLAQGDLSQRLPVAGPPPLARLAQSLNRMANQLEDRLGAVVQQRNELQAVLASMEEGVLAVDNERKVLSLNRAAADLLGIDAARALGRALPQVVRHAALAGFVDRALAGEGPAEDTLIWQPAGQAGGPADTVRYFQVQGVALRDAGGGRIGALLVLQDETHLRRLERVRRDFVANASHEMRTPVAAIKAAIETVLAEESPPPEDAQRFLQMIDRQANRLQAIIEDMLALARIEQESRAPHLERVHRPLLPVLEAAVQTCQPKAQYKQAQVRIDCPPALAALIHPPMLEQAVVNLLDNAIKFSPRLSRIELRAEPAGDEVMIAVKDQGPGIAPEHLPRMFERFYRPDKARSRALGGTGLGLAIVKHIAQAHGGRVSVASVPGQGSVFRLHLPREARA